MERNVREILRSHTNITKQKMKGLHNGSAIIEEELKHLQNGSPKKVEELKNLHNRSGKKAEELKKLQNGSAKKVEELKPLQNGSAKKVGELKDLQNGSAKNMEENKKLHNGSAKNGMVLNNLQNGIAKKAEEIKNVQNRSSVMGELEEPPLIEAIMSYIGYMVILIISQIRVFIHTYITGFPAHLTEAIDKEFHSLVPMNEIIIRCWCFRRVTDVEARPVCSAPGAEIELMDRVTYDHGWNVHFTGTISKVFNMGSYNYLGFSQNKGKCTDSVERVVNNLGLGVCGSRQELGYLNIHKELDELVAEYLGVEAAITIPMGFATNSMNMPALVEKGCLILSDELNHASLVIGCRLSGATIRTFKHNCVEDLEMKLREAIVKQQPRTHRPWKKILIVVEGIYSMEGTILRLPEIIALKKKYKAYLYVDEAHSIGALGPHGKGVVDFFGADPKDIDILMGTFTKSFGSMGGYIAGPKRLINHLRVKSHAAIYSPTMAPCTVQQVLFTMRTIMGKHGGREGIARIEQLRSNTLYFRRRLHEMGFIVYGSDDSPVVPLIMFSIAKTVAFSRLCLSHGIGVVVVGYPATPITKCRARFCLSASHTRESLDKALKVIDGIGDELMIKLSKRKR